MLISGLLRRMGRTARYFSAQNQLKEIQDQFGFYSKQSLEAYLTHAWTLINQKKAQEARENFQRAIDISKQIFGPDARESAAILHRIGKSFENVEDIETALEYYLQAYESEKKILPEDHDDLLFSANRIGAIYADLGDVKKAEDFLGKIFNLVLLSKHEELKAAYFGNYAHVKMREGDSEKALNFFLMAKEQQGKLNPKDEMMTKYLQSIGMCYWVTNQHELAKENFQNALEILNENPEKYSLQIVDVYSHLAYLHNDLKKGAEMLQYFEKALDVFKSSTTEDKNNKIADYLKNICETMKSVGDLPNSLFFTKKYLNFSKESFGENSRFTGDAYQMMSSIYLKQNNFDEALKYVEHSLASRKSLENNHYDLVFSYNQYAAVYHTMGDLQSAEKYLKMTEEILNKHPASRLKTSHHHNVSLLARDKKNFPEAEFNMLKHIEGVIEEYGEKHPATAAAYSGLGHIHRMAQNYEKGLEAYKKALALSEETLGKEHVATADYLEYIGEIYRLQKNFPEAIKCHLQNLELKIHLLGSDHFSVHIPYYNLATTYGDAGDFTNSLNYCQKRLDLFKSLFGNMHSYVAGSYAYMAEIHIKAKNNPSAIECLTKAKEILIAVKNPNAAAGMDAKIAELSR
jgi:tetratricopeptide (TPR) repeat protein